MRNTKTIMMGVLGFVLFILITVLSFFIKPEMISDNILITTALYVLVTKGIILGKVSYDVNRLTHSKFPAVFGFIPYVQVVCWTSSTVDIIVYFILLVLMLVSPILLFSDFVLNFVGVNGLTSYGTVAPIISGVFLLLWRIMHFKIYGSAMQSIKDRLDEEIGERAGWTVITDWLQRISLLLPFLSILGVVTLFLDVWRLENVMKNKRNKKKQASSNSSLYA